MHDALDASSTPTHEGHLFVIQGDLRRIMADAVLYPTRNSSNPQWFPDGPPTVGNFPARELFTRERRVWPVANQPSGEPALWLGWVYWEADDEPPLEWFLAAADQFLRAAREDLANRTPLCDRYVPLLALPVVGTGLAGAKLLSGRLLARLMALLDTFARTEGVDIVLVTRSTQMFSAAQATRLRMDREAASQGRMRSWDCLSPRLFAEATRLAELSVSGQLVLFLGSGCCRTVGLPGWSDLLTELGEWPS